MEYKTRKIERVCTNLKKSRKELGTRVADALFGLINLLESSESLEDINALRIYKVHKLVGNLNGFYALDIDGRSSSYRLVIQPLNNDNEVVINNDNLEIRQFYRSIKIIRIEEVSKHYA